jgi:hypothetical protein
MSDKKCDWTFTPNSTPFRHPRTREMVPGFPDEWTIGCVKTGTLRIVPKLHWEKCPYCGQEINWAKRAEPSAPQEAPKPV